MEAREVEVDPAVVVVVAPGGALDEAHLVQADRRGDLGERAVPVVAEQLAGMERHARLVRDEQVDQPVVVEVAPAGARGRMEAEQARRLGHVLEGPVSTVPERRVRVLPRLPQPGTAHHVDVAPAVVVEVRVRHVEAAELSLQPSLGRAVPEGAVPLVPVEAQLVRGAPGGRQQVQVAVVVQVLHHDAAGERGVSDADQAPHVDETLELVLRLEDAGRDPPALGNFPGVLPQGHVGQVEEPAEAQ